MNPSSLLLSLALTALPVRAADTDEVVPPPGAPFPLPEAMEPRFTGKVASDFHFRVARVPDFAGKVTLEVAYRWEGAGGEVVVKVFHAGPTSYVASRVDRFATSFAPTTACRASAVTDEVFVAGWDAERRRAVIERWAVGRLAVGEVSGKEGPDPTLSELTFERQVLWSREGPDARPIEALACDGRERMLYLLEYGPEGRLSALDLVGEPIREPVRVADESTIPGLADIASISTGEHADFGTVFLMRRRRAWEPSFPKAVHVFRDRDGDMRPDFERLEELTIDAYRELFPREGWESDG